MICQDEVIDMRPLRERLNVNVEMADILSEQPDLLSMQDSSVARGSMGCILEM